MANLTEKVALVTGAGSGIGLELARGLLARGCKVVAGDIRLSDEFVSLKKSSEGRLLGAIMDVTSDQQVDAAVAMAKVNFGALDILINNAGLFTTVTRGPFEDLSIAEWEKVFAVNVTGVFRTVTACLPMLKASGHGRIVNITSATVFSAPPNMLHYVATKGALTAMTRSMARELGVEGITVNAVAPGFTLSSGVVRMESDTTAAQIERARNVRAIKRDQMPEDLIGATCFLASEDASFITGQTLVVDGGAVMH